MMARPKEPDRRLLIAWDWAVVMALIGLLALLIMTAAGCAPRRPPIVDATTPVPVGCGAFPPLVTTCLETLPADATDAETIRCYAETVAQLQTEENAWRAQFAPCAR